MFVPTLRHITLAKIAVVVYTDREIRNLEKELQKPLHLLPGQSWESIIKEKLPAFVFPLVLQNEIVALMRAISFEVQQWMDDHHGILFTDDENFIRFCWNSNGTIDRLGTADFLIKSEHLSFEKRFSLACQYWPGTCILAFWRAMPRCAQTCILQKYADECSIDTIHKANVKLWITWLKEGCSCHNINCNYKCILQSFHWTKVTIHSRLLQNLFRTHRDILVTGIIKYCRSTVFVRSCLVKIDASVRKEILNSYPYQVLRIFLFWPFQDLFIDAANGVWEKLSEKLFACLLHIIICQKITLEWRDYNYVHLLRRFWHESPAGYKKYVQKTNIFLILTEFIQRGYLQNSIPGRFLLHDRDALRNAELCKVMTDNHFKLQ
ncbi:uncharacterized protein NPIL_378311 [Nephila pilipes]|uniref:Uncharacterized protein n=1 Tax=Nephila pilipes TaxID=299642 RepID=A0A8X6QCY0_NEPPI|nr:uncharacterized protein NPIL_378311 [Nephila pilipes]